MSTHAYTEDQLVEQPAIGLFAELGWSTVSAMEETFGVAGTLGRETKGDVVLASRLREALERLNPALPPDAIIAAVSRIWPVSPSGEMAYFSEIPARPTGHRGGHPETPIDHLSLYVRLDALREHQPN